MKNPVLTFIVMIALLGCATPGSKEAGYGGHGASSVSEATLAKYAATALPSEVSEKIEKFLDIRAPGTGILNPSGKKLFFGWNVTGTQQVWRLDAPEGFPIQMTGGQDRTHIREVTPDGKWIILSRDRNGEENPGIYCQSVDGGPLYPIQHKKGVQTFFEFVSDDSRWIYFRANDIKADSYAIYRYDLATKNRELVFSQDGIWSVGDSKTDGRLLLQKAISALASEHYEWNPATKELTPVVGQGEKEEYTVAYSAAEGEFLVLTPKFGEFRRLYRMKGGKFTAISPEMKHDVADFAIDRPRLHIVYGVNESGYFRTHALNAKTYGELKLPSFPDADHVFTGALSRNGQTVAFSVITAKAPRTSYSYNWNTRKLTRWVVPSAPEVDLSQFAKSVLEYYPARDGTPIPMFVRRPAQCAKAAAPCPVVVHFHGGPEGQSLPGFDTYAQMVVDAGFVFVEPNVRGSDGYGKTWLDADNGPKRLSVITDIEDCSQFIRTNWGMNGVAPKIGIMGWSYGGYSTLIGMSMFAGAYDAGVAMVGMSNLVTFLKNTAPYRRVLRISEYGDPEKDLDSLVKLSPMTYLDRIKAPLMIIQGVSDPRVPAGESVQIQEALAVKNIPSQLILFGDEGHGAQKRSNQVLEMGHLIHFFEKHLKQ